MVFIIAVGYWPLLLPKPAGYIVGAIWLLVALPILAFIVTRKSDLRKRQNEIQDVNARAQIITVNGRRYAYIDKDTPNNIGHPGFRP